MYFWILFLFLIPFHTTWAQESEDKWNRVYLATYPRSGNHWVRYLIEEATHIATSGVYKTDFGGFKEVPTIQTPFPWGAYCSKNGYEGHCRYPTINDPVVIKTHKPFFYQRYNNQPHTKAIRIVRHPIDCIYSSYVLFSSLKNKKILPFIPRFELAKYVNKWREHLKYWDKQPNVVTIRYEDLCEQPEFYLKMILDECGFQVTDEDVKRAVKAYPPRIELLKHIGHYTPDDLDYIHKNLKDLLNEYKYQIPGRR